MSNQFIPRAEPPAARAAFLETSDDSIWENPTDHDILLRLYVGCEPLKADNNPVEKQIWANMDPRVRDEKRTGYRKLTIPAKSTRVISRDFDREIHQYECTHPDCNGSKKLYCKDVEHAEYKRLVGGLYPQLIWRGTQSTPLSYRIPVDKVLKNENEDLESAVERARRQLEEVKASGDKALSAQVHLLDAQRLHLEAEIRAEAERKAQAEKEAAAAHAREIARAVNETTKAPVAPKNK